VGVGAAPADGDARGDREVAHPPAVHPGAAGGFLDGQQVVQVGGGVAHGWSSHR
jgi:hypothetical protein